MTWIIGKDKELTWVVSREEVARLLFHEREVDLIQAEAEGLPFHDMVLGRELERRYDLAACAEWLIARERRRTATER